MGDRPVHVGSGFNPTGDGILHIAQSLLRRCAIRDASGKIKGKGNKAAAIVWIKWPDHDWVL